MPASIVKSFATKSGKSIGEVEDLWKKAKKIAAEEGRKEDYAYITGILKKMLNLNESTSFKEYLVEIDEINHFRQL